jgi:hypothetical protein
MYSYRTRVAFTARALYVLVVADLLLAAVNSPLNAQADVQTALNGTSRQAYNSQESVLVSSAMQSGSVAVTSNGGTDAVVWALADMTANYGTLLAYDAASLQLLWCSSALDSCDSSSAFTTSLFAVPTIVNGYAYVPTSGINRVPSTSHAYTTCTSSAPCYRVLVYSGY